VAILCVIGALNPNSGPQPRNTAAPVITAGSAWATTTPAARPTTTTAQRTTAKAQPTTARLTTTTPRPVTTSRQPAAPADTLTGYGATIAAWNAHHTADTYYDPGSAYDPDLALPRNAGRVWDKYVAVQPLGGRVTDYTVHLVPMSLANAQAILTAEFPADTRVLWTQHLSGCTQVEYTSPTLHTALGNTDTGDALVEYSNTDSSSALVTEAMVSDMPGAQPDPSATC
jgi:hypothetical protein